MIAVVSVPSGVRHRVGMKMLEAQLKAAYRCLVKQAGITKRMFADQYTLYGLQGINQLIELMQTNKRTCEEIRPQDVNLVRDFIRQQITVEQYFKAYERIEKYDGPEDLEKFYKSE